MKALTLMVVVGPPESVEIIETIASRVGAVGAGIIEAHRFGHGPGPINEPWELAFHRAAVGPLAELLGWPYLLGIAHAYSNCAALMLEVSSPRFAALEWSHLTSYLNNAATTITATAPHDTITNTPSNADDLGPDIPRLIPFHQLAEIVSITGAIGLADIGTKVTQACQTGRTCPLDPEQLAWLRRINDGATIRSLATEIDVSERNLRRHFRTIYTQLGTNGLRDTLTHARTHRWIT